MAFLRQGIFLVCQLLRKPLPEGSRLYEAVSRAGGLSEDADVSRINEASLLSDGQHIHVPREGEAWQDASEGSSEEIVNINTAGPETFHLLNYFAERTRVDDTYFSYPGNEDCVIGATNQIFYDSNLRSLNHGETATGRALAAAFRMGQSFPPPRRCLMRPSTAAGVSVTAGMKSLGT